MSSTGDRDDAVVAGTVTLRANEGVVMSLARDVLVPPSTRRLAPASMSVAIARISRRRFSQP